MVWVLLQPFYWVIAKVFKFNKLKQDLCAVLNTIYVTESFNHKDYIISFYLFDGFVIRHKKTKAILASGSYAWDGFLKVETDLKFPESTPNIYPLKFDNSPISDNLTLFYSKGLINQIEQKITISFENNEPLRLNQKTIYKEILLAKNRKFEPIILTLETYDLEEMYGNQIDYREYPVSCCTVHDLYLSYSIERMKEDQNAINLLPELFQDSVCDYNDKQFTARVLLLEMLKF